jgi:ABC-2 type transport system permease protein
MKAFLSMVRANLKMTLRDRTRLFWLLLFPTVLIVVFGSLVGGNTNSEISVGVVNGGATPVAKQMTTAIRGSKFLALQSGTEKAELAKLRDGEIDVVVVFPKEATPGQPLRVRSYVNESQPGTSQAASAAIQQIASTFNEQAAGVRKPQLVAISTQGLQGKNMNYVDFLVPGVLAMSIMNGGIVGLSAAFVVMRERGVLRRIKVTPFPLISFITARVATQLLVALCQAAILLGLAKLIFNLDIVGNLLEVAVFIFLGSLAFLTIGFFVAGVSRKQESATALAQLISFPMLFLSGVFFPLDRAPMWLQDVARALPLTYLADGLRQVMVYGVSLASLWGDLLALVLTIAIGLALAARFFRWEPRAS